MNKKNRLLLLLLFILLQSNFLFAQNTISYKEFISKIKNQLPQIQKTQLSIKLAENKIKQASSITDPVLNFNTNLMQEYQYTATTRNYIHGFGVGAEITQKNIENGTSLQYGIASFFGDYKVPQIYINYSYPLFYNSGGMQDKFTVYAAQNNFDIEKWKQLESDAQILNKYKKLYFQWIQTKAAINLLEKSIINAKNLRQNAKAKYKSGLIDLDDVEKTESLIIKYQNQLVQYQISLNKLLASIKPYINNLKLIPNDSDMRDQITKINTKNLSAMNIKNNSSFKVYELQKQYFNEYKKVLENRLTPKTDLNLQVALKGRDESFYQSVRNFEDLDYSAAIVISMPIEKAKEKADLEALDISTKLLEQNILQNTNLLQSQRDQIIANIEGQQNQLILSQKNLKNLNKRYKIEAGKYDKARLNLSFLIETQNAIISEKINTINLKLNIIFNYLDLALVSGVE